MSILKSWPQYRGQHDGASINRIDFTLSTQSADPGLLATFSVRLIHVVHKITGDITKKCLLSTFVRALLSVGEAQLGKHLYDLIGKWPFTGRYLC